MEFNSTLTVRHLFQLIIIFNTFIPFMKNILFTTVLLITGLLSSCKKNSDGGKALVKVHFHHHGKKAWKPVLFIRFNCKNAPSDPEQEYDIKIEAQTHDDHIHVEGLRYGEYYFTLLAEDSLTKEGLKGGVPVKIAWSERKSEKEIEIPLAE